MLPKHEYRPLCQGEYITKAQFGVNLYEAIKTLGGIMGLERQRVVAIYHGEGYTASDLMTRRAKLVKDWEHHRAILTHEDIMQMMARYPWARDL